MHASCRIQYVTQWSNILIFSCISYNFYVNYLLLWGRKNCSDNVITDVLSRSYLKYLFGGKRVGKFQSIFLSASNRHVFFWSETYCINSGLLGGVRSFDKCLPATRCRQRTWRSLCARLSEATEVSKFRQQMSCLTARWKENHKSEERCQSPLLFFSFGLVLLLQKRWNRTNKLDWFVVFWAKWLYSFFSVVTQAGICQTAFTAKQYTVAELEGYQI